MKKIITLPDGTKQEIEGTPEEIAQYEKQLREGGATTNDYYPPGASTPRRILNEDVKIATDDINTCPCKTCVEFKKLSEKIEKLPTSPFYTIPMVPCVHEYPEVWHGIVPPNCKKCGVAAFVPLTVTSTTTAKISS